MRKSYNRSNSKKGARAVQERVHLPAVWRVGVVDFWLFFTPLSFPFSGLCVWLLWLVWWGEVSEPFTAIYIIILQALWRIHLLLSSFVLFRAERRSLLFPPTTTTTNQIRGQRMSLPQTQTYTQAEAPAPFPPLLPLCVCVGLCFFE